MRQQDSTDDGRGRSSAPSAGELGWDDGLYEDRDSEADRRRPPRRGPAPPGGRERTRAEHGMAGKSGGPAGARGDRDRPGSLRRRVFRWVTLTLSLLILGTAAAGYFYYEHLNGNLSSDDLSLGDHKLDPSDPNAKGQRPLNILLLGSDSRNSERNLDLGGSEGDAGRPPLADVQKLLHVSADRSSMTVLSVPRDTRVTIPKCSDADQDKVFPKTVDKINASLQHGGPGCTVATWEALTGIPIDHFMMIDFSGVVSMADAVGGVPVCVDKNVHDPKSGLRLKKGTSVIKGEQALQWLRTRHGFGDGSDIGRAKAQHLYMSSMVRQLKAGTKLSDPGKLRKLAEAATKALTVDHGLGSVKKLYDLGKDLKQVPTNRITMATMPWEYSPGGSYVVPKPGDAEKVFSLIRQDIALDGKDKKKPEEEPTGAAEDADPASEIPVHVMNGTATGANAAVPGRAGAVSQALQNEGFTRALADQTPKPQVDTRISYATEGQRSNALAVAEALGVPERMVRHSSEVEEITVVVGADWRTGATYPAEAADDGADEDANKAPDSTESVNGGDKEGCMEVNPGYTW
ncbi:LCP family protein [Streptomyces oceani]|uniref:Transcriptional regulator n=1 Tax=Streptomyces oceani TaxID=1075402 RepID=A0A1E7KNE8_9ACTN|nr:LCP family protein [Streptomyces oceani]OEV05465.1 transcriptional regulator [Streptomyces oceani]